MEFGQENLGDITSTYQFTIDRFDGRPSGPFSESPSGMLTKLQLRPPHPRIERHHPRFG